MEVRSGLVVHMKNSRSTYKLLIGQIVYYLLTTLCLMVLFLIGISMFILVSIPILFVLLVHYTVLRLEEAYTR